MGESQRLLQRGRPRRCGCWAAKGLVSENPPKVCITGSKGVKWAEGEKGPQGSLGKALVEQGNARGRGPVAWSPREGSEGPGLILQDDQLP